MKEPQQQQAQAWQAVWSLLQEICPDRLDWNLFRSGGATGQEAVCNTIRELVKENVRLKGIPD